MSGLFVSIEGPDASGKSLVVSNLRKHIKDVVVVKQPGGTGLSAEIRRLIVSWHKDLEPSTELLLFFTSLVHLSKTVVKPALAEGKLVVADRWFYSLYAYQLYSRGLGSKYEDLLTQMLETFDISFPDLNLIIS